MTQCLGCPARGPIGVTRSAWVGDLVFVRHFWRYEPKRVGMNSHVREGGLNLWHVTRHTLGSRAPNFVVGVLFERRSTRPI